MPIWRFVGWSCETPRTAPIAVCRSTVSWSRCSQRSLRRRQKQGRVFLTDRGNPYKNRTREEGGQCRSAWTSACRRAGIVDLHQHDLCHTFATWGLIAGMSDRVKKEIMGHSSSEMSDRYAHVPLREAIAAIDLIPPVGMKRKANRHGVPGVSRKQSDLGKTLFGSRSLLLSDQIKGPVELHLSAVRADIRKTLSSSASFLRQTSCSYPVCSCLQSRARS